MEEDVEGKERDARVSGVLAGKLDNLPVLNSKVVRIFLSSTFSDFKLERNYLMENVYPKLKQICRDRYGLEFQVVDMRWGVRENAEDQHLVSELCIQEIHNCQRLSVGPNFVVLMGQRYGYRPIPSVIPSSEMQMLRDVIKGSTSSLETLETWYREDVNAVPSEYVLQPVSSILHNYYNKSDPAQMEQDKVAWCDIQAQLQGMLKRAARALFEGGKMTHQQMHKYYMSVTEDEIRHGVINTSTSKDHCLAYIRHIQDLDVSCLPHCKAFLNMHGQEIDQESTNLLTTFTNKVLPPALPEENTERYRVEWCGEHGGMHAEAHEDYLKDLSQDLYEGVLRMVHRAMDHTKALEQHGVYSEVLQHLHACHGFCSTFTGRKMAVERILEYVQGQADQPLVLHGKSGSGKSALLARGYKQVADWCNLVPQSPVLVLRFLGTTPDSTSVVPLLTSLCQHISYNYRKPCDDLPEEVFPLIRHLKTLLELATEEKPLFLFLDALDQLTEADGAHQLAWLPTDLPPHVKVVVTTLPNYYGILNTLQKMIPNPKYYLQVGSLGPHLGNTVLKSMLQNGNRKISEQQWMVVNDALEKCNLPLYLKLLYEEISKWKSYSKPDETILEHTIQGSLNKLFTTLEKYHGRTLVLHALAYITASKDGLSESELEDLLSLDDDVLSDVFQFHLPPSRRFPPILWARIKGDLPQAFSERDVGGVNVIGWYHREFRDCAVSRYCRDLNFVADIHGKMAEYYLGTWGGGKQKPYQFNETEKKQLNVCEDGGEADRMVPSQPLYFTDESEEITHFNLRKLSELPYHLLRANRVDDLYESVLFNFKFLHAKLSCMALHTLLTDLEDSLSYQYDRDVKLLLDTLRLSASVLGKQPDMLGPVIVGRLLPFYSSYEKIRDLIEQCDQYGPKVNALVPVFHHLHSPGGPLQYSLEGHPFAPYGVALTSDARFLVSVSSVCLIWDLSNGELVRQLDPEINGIMPSLCITPDDKRAVSYTSNNELFVTNIMTGEFKLEDDIIEEALEILGIKCNNETVMVWTLNAWFLFDTHLNPLQKSSASLDKSVVCFEIAKHDHDWMVVQRNEKKSPYDSGNMTVEFFNSDTQSFSFNNAMAISKDARIIYACDATDERSVAVYEKAPSGTWVLKKVVSDIDQVFFLQLSDDESCLVATVTSGFQVCDLLSGKRFVLNLPEQVRNIPGKNQTRGMSCLTKNNDYLVAAVRKYMYIWAVKDEILLRKIDVHFGRIIAMESIVHGGNNHIVTSSLDKTIKVWNVENILEDFHEIDKFKEPIQGICPAMDDRTDLVTARKCAGVWDLATGKLNKTLVKSQRPLKVTHGMVTGDGTFAAIVEGDMTLIWDVENGKVIGQYAHGEVLQLMLTDEDTRLLILSKAQMRNGKATCRTVPDGKIVYEFNFNLTKRLQKAVTTSDGLFLVVPAFSSKAEEVLSLYHTRTGTYLYDIIPEVTNYSHLVNLATKPTQIALIGPDAEGGTIMDIKKKTRVKTVKKWNGVCSSDGKLGVYAPGRGGLELLDMKTGSTVRTLIPRGTEGAVSNTTLFTKNDEHVVYYHSGKKTIQVFRVSDGRRIGMYLVHAAIQTMVSMGDGRSLVCGAEDGGVFVLYLADPVDPDAQQHLRSLPSRQIRLDTNRTHLADNYTPRNKRKVNLKFRTIAHIAKVPNSKACVIL